MSRKSEYDASKLSASYTRSAAVIIECFEDDERKATLEELKGALKISSNLIKKLNHARSVRDRLCHMEEENEQNDGTVDILQEYEGAISSFKADETKSEMVLEFERCVEAMLQGKQCNEHHDENDGDEDMQLTGGYVNVIDPISKKRMVNPVKNSICGHTYESKAITDLLEMNKRTRCPVVGCRSKEYVSLIHLKPDVVTQAYLAQNPE